MNYEKFLESKMQSAPMSGLEPGKLNENFFHTNGILRGI